MPSTWSPPEQSVSATADSVLSTVLKPSASSMLPSSSVLHDALTISKSFAKTTTSKLQHLESPSFISSKSSMVGSSSTTDRGKTSDYVPLPESKTTTLEATRRSMTRILFVSTKSVIMPSITQQVTAITSIVVDHIQTFLITFEGICPSSNKHDAFKNAFLLTIRRLIDIESSLIDIIAIKCGSVKVVFSVKCEETCKITEILEGLVRDGEFQVSMDGMIFKALNITVWEPTTLPTLSTTTSKDNPSVHAQSEDQKRAIKITFILFSAVFGALALFGAVICIAKSCGRRQYGKLRVNSSTASTRGTNQLYKNELELVRLSPLHHGADYYGGHVVQSRDDSDDDNKIDNRTALLNRLRNDEVASRRGKIIVKDDDSYSSIAFY